MKYALLIYTDETVELSQDEQNTLFAEYTAFGKEAHDNILSSEGPFMPTSSATTVRVRDGQTLVVDGPFAETKEQLGGFYIVECTNLDDAIALAAKIPNAKDGSIEVRPVMDLM